MSIVLVNATGKPVYVVPDGGKKPVLLPETPAPSLIEMTHDGATSLNLVLETEPGKNVTATVKQDSSRPEHCLTICLPPVLDGTLYLVEPEVMFRFPWRTDFVAPSTYGHIRSGKKGKRCWTLTSVRRGPLAESNPHTPSLENLFEQADLSGNSAPPVNPQ